ncbi:MAG: FAD-binding oxidoreductase, partial [Crenarchaeota archaeon]|nr:FAD-binding oxidoreductase [Thermoproteota archaeon]
LRPVPEEAAFWTGASDHLGRPFSWEPEPRPEPWFYEYGLLPVIRAYLPRLGGLRAETGWAGFYDISIDSQPVVHSVPGLVAAGGTSGSGIMKADAIGRIAAAAALGREWAELYGGERFRVEWLGLRGRRVEEEKLVI